MTKLNSSLVNQLAEKTFFLWVHDLLMKVEHIETRSGTVLQEGEEVHAVAILYSENEDGHVFQATFSEKGDVVLHRRTFSKDITLDCFQEEVSMRLYPHLRELRAMFHDSLNEAKV